MSVPVVYGVCRANPDSRFVLLTKAPTAPLFVNPPANLTVVGADMKERYKGVAGLLRLLGELHREHRFDAFADLHDVIRTRIIRLACRMRGIRVGAIRKGRREKARRCNGTSATLQLPSSTERYAEVFRRLGLDTDSSFRSVYDEVPPDSRLYADVTPPRPAGERWIGIAPFAAHAPKIYPPEQMKKVVEALAADPSTRIFLFGGGEKERTVLGEWASGRSNVISLADRRHGFPAELALMSSLDCMVAMDSGNMHLASLAGIPTVSIWGATHPDVGFRPWQFEATDAVGLPLDCRPCSVFGSRPCRRGDHACMTGITPETIINRIQSLTTNRR